MCRMLRVARNVLYRIAHAHYLLFRTRGEKKESFTYIKKKSLICAISEVPTYLYHVYEYYA